MLERDVLSQTLLAIGGRKDARAWRQQSGTFVPLQAHATCPNCRTSGPLKLFDPHPITKVGVNGMADIGLILHDGRSAWIECKHPETGRVSEDQYRFKYTIERFNGIYLVARSAEEALSQLRNRGYCND